MEQSGSARTAANDPAWIFLRKLAADLGVGDEEFVLGLPPQAERMIQRRSRAAERMSHLPPELAYALTGEMPTFRSVRANVDLQRALREAGSKRRSTLAGIGYGIPAAGAGGVLAHVLSGGDPWATGAGALAAGGGIGILAGTAERARQRELAGQLVRLRSQYQQAEEAAAKQMESAARERQYAQSLAQQSQYAQALQQRLMAARAQAGARGRPQGERKAASFREKTLKNVNRPQPRFHAPPRDRGGGLPAAEGALGPATDGVASSWLGESELTRLASIDEERLEAAARAAVRKLGERMAGGMTVPSGAGSKAQMGLPSMMSAGTSPRATSAPTAADAAAAGQPKGLPRMPGAPTPNTNLAAGQPPEPKPPRFASL